MLWGVCHQCQQVADVSLTAADHADSLLRWPALDCRASDCRSEGQRGWDQLRKDCSTICSIHDDAGAPAVAQEVVRWERRMEEEGSGEGVAQLQRVGALHVQRSIATPFIRAIRASRHSRQLGAP